ncbi:MULTISPECIES: hypothetical protein [Calothrix]|uniref:Uncharacterized protein n=2 Tax=Calothrix TaxID=1186 RepID=A0ABR8AIV7_9CYAN|nr:MULTISPECIES: hypothetical protein [Calothrix]MBD2199873.1 hypothetical protein [Calothrix parietina FACHB-288]MBD2228780.1 hypothetical protein [Calothrix anomala FACHB-343]
MTQTHSEADKLKQKLQELIAIASQVEIKLADRLKAIASPLEKMPSGTMMSRKHLLLGLKEILADAEFWLCYRLANPEEKQQIKDAILQIHRYWHLEIFPTWFNKHDKDFPRWKESLIKNEPPPDDAKIINEISRSIRSQQRQKKDYQTAKFISKLIADKAIDTDLIATANQDNPLCVQLTQSAKEHTDNKIREWKETYNYYAIKRGLFAGYNPQHPQYITWLTKHIVSGADDIPKEDYKDVFLK